MGVFNFFERFGKKQSDGSVVIDLSQSGEATVLIPAVEELAMFSVIDLIASAAACCEWRTYQNGKPRKMDDWYRWNVEPNQNQNAAEFKRLLFARLLRYNEALVFERGGEYFLADSFTRKEFAFLPNVYSNITVNNLTLSYNLTEPDVLYFRLANQKAAALIAALDGMYSEAMQEAMAKYKKSGGRYGALYIEASETGKPDFKDKLADLMNKNFRTFFNSKNAVIPLTKGYEYKPLDGPSTAKGSSEVSDMESVFRQAQDRACNAFHVPPCLLRGDVSGIDDAMSALIAFALRPPIETVQTETSRKLYSRAILDGWELRIHTNGIRVSDVFKHADKIEKLIQNSMYNTDEMRRLIGEDEIGEEWAKEYVRTKNAEGVTNNGQANVAD